MNDTTNNDNNDNYFRSESDLSRLLGQHDADRMKLTRQEHEHALNIKEAIEGLPDLDNLSDLMYVQLAIVCRDNVDDAVQRCYELQNFRREYKIVDSYEQGCHYLEWITTVLPTFFISFDYNHVSGRYMIVYDIEKFDPGVFTSPKMVNNFMGFLYYEMMVGFPDVEAMRKGIMCIVETMGLTWRRGAMKQIVTIYSELVARFPFNGTWRWHHTSTMVNVFAATLRKILPQHIRQHLQTGCDFHTHLGEALLVPTVEAANQRMIQSMTAALTLRQHNELHFSLRY